MKFFKVIIIVVSILAALMGAGVFTEKMYWELDLSNGVARAEYSYLGIVLNNVTNVHNPTLCPSWSEPNLAKTQSHVSYACYKHFETESCIENVKLYEKSYEDGCAT